MSRPWRRAIWTAGLVLVAATAPAPARANQATRARSAVGCQRLAAGVVCPSSPIVVREPSGTAKPDRPRRPSGAEIERALGARIAALSEPGPELGLWQPWPGSPESLRQAYDLVALSRDGGIGKTVAMVELGGDPQAESDLAAYRSFFGLPPCTVATGCFLSVDKDGGPPTSAGAPSVDETSLDLDAVSALCPNCHLLLVDAEGDTAAAQATAVRLGAQIISDSWVKQGPNALYETYTWPGIATVASSGDAGHFSAATATGFAAPSSLPNVTAAGGTDLTPASTSGVPSLRGYTETAWSGSGSTCDPFIAKPPWQADSGCAGRSIADLSADGGTAIPIYDSEAGGWVGAAGTSLSAPLIAAFYAITDAPAENPSWAYQSAAALNDIVAGGNGSCPASAAYICNAGPGYDGPTGVGSISGSAVRGAPGIGGPSMASRSYTQRASYEAGPETVSAALEGGVYTNGLPTTYRWQYGRTVFEAETAPVALPASCSISYASAHLTGLEPSGGYRYRLVAQNAAGTTYGYTTALDANPGELPSPEPALPSSEPATPCPTPSPLPDAPNPAKPTTARQRRVASVRHVRVRGRVLSFRVACPATSTRGCIVKLKVRVHHRRGRAVAHVAAGARRWLRFRFWNASQGQRAQLKIWVREPPHRYVLAVSRHVRVGRR